MKKQKKIREITKNGTCESELSGTETLARGMLINPALFNLLKIS
jgi:hypothetical protein